VQKNYSPWTAANDDVKIFTYKALPVPTTAFFSADLTTGIKARSMPLIMNRRKKASGSNRVCSWDRPDDPRHPLSEFGILFP
jgi:hypothetical protein